MGSQGRHIGGSYVRYRFREFVLLRWHGRAQQRNDRFQRRAAGFAAPQFGHQDGGLVIGPSLLLIHALNNMETLYQ